MAALCFRSCGSRDDRESKFLKPPRPTSFQYVSRRPDGFCLEWHLEDPLGAPVTDCELVLGGSAMFTYLSFEEGGKPARFGPFGGWRATINKLAGDTVYVMRARGYNSEGPGAWSQVEVKTSEMPCGPSGLRCSSSYATSIALEWSLADPDGAKVSECDIEVLGAFGWGAADLSGDSVSRTVGDSWRAVVSNLAANAGHEIRVRGRNDVGCGPWSMLRTSTATPPQPPSEVRCVRRLGNELVLEWAIDDPEGAPILTCDVQILELIRWVDVQAVCAAKSKDTPFCWRINVQGLQPECNYGIRICGCNSVGRGEWWQGEFRTQDRPAPPYALKSTPTASKLDIEWKIDDLDGAAITRCSIEVRGSLGWAPAVLEACGVPMRANEALTWKATIVELSGNTAYSIRIRGHNIFSDGEWAQHEVRTSTVPTVPNSVVCTRHLAEKLCLQWHVRDPEGAEVTSCEVQVQGILRWSPALFDHGAEPQKMRATLHQQMHAENAWCATITGLTIDTPYFVRVRGVNRSGIGEWSDVHEFNTSGKPGTVLNFKVTDIGEDHASMEWEVEDPDGAPVIDCNLEILVHYLVGSPQWSLASFQADGQPSRVDKKVWTATIVGLKHNDSHSIRISAQNDAGTGKWSRYDFQCR